MRSLSLDCESASTRYTEPASSVRSPATRSVPMEFPGAMMPPACTVVPPTVPVPCSTASRATVTWPPSLPCPLMPTDKMP
ncbi:hypothetical protein G6F61_014794 [Rhizopus arrhizus]|nr:hypothetical protein G6F31_021785 [Rhizopus arrhizus]KAG1345583.1 hypothetical protein G6F61_014794 [Rhizopus arrhizus]